VLLEDRFFAELARVEDRLFVEIGKVVDFGCGCFGMSMAEKNEGYEGEYCWWWGVHCIVWLTSLGVDCCEG
jgi:hypothetical protein